MELVICQNCGATLEGKLTNCPSCEGFVAGFAATSIPSIPQIVPLLAASLDPQQADLERFLLSQPSYLASLPLVGQAKKGNGNGETQVEPFEEPVLARASTNGSIANPIADFFSVAPPLQPSQAQDESKIQSKSVEPVESPAESIKPVKSVTPDTPHIIDSVSVKTNTDLNHSEISPLEKTSVAEEEAKSTSTSSPAPNRRSFSGSGTATIKPSLADSFKSFKASPEKETSKGSGEFELFGMTFTKKKATIIGIAAAAILFVALSAIISLVGALFSATGGHMGANPNAVTGMWRFAVQTNQQQKVYRGVMLLHQRGTEIFGAGQDNAMGSFRFSGSLKGPQIEFVKQYSRANQNLGKPIVFQGTIDPGTSPLFAHGAFETTFRQGFGWRGRIISVTGTWEAELIKPMREDAGNADQNPSIIRPTSDSNPQGFANKFFIVAVGLLGGVIFIFYLCFNFFSPDGWRAQGHKEKYIPSQFKKHHQKDLKEMSQPLQAGSLPLGQRQEWHPWTFWITKELALPPAARASNPHTLLLGGGEKGKSRLMARMITHDIESNDRALILIDSDGSLADLITHWISVQPNSEELTKRVALIDPTYSGGSLAYNPLQMPEDGDLQSAASAIEYGFKAIYTEPPGSQTQWNKQTANILRNAALLLMINGKTLTDLSTLLQDNDFRDILLEGAERKRKEKVEYTTLLETWGQYKRLARTEQWINWVEPILNRVTPTLSDPRIRPILTKEVGDINLRDVIMQKKILIVKIPKGQLHENANLLGSLIVTGIKQAALSIALKANGTDKPVSLYLDEFDNFIEKETFTAITSETKKFQIGFIGAVKTLQDFPEDFRNQLVINVGTMAIFALAKKDGDMLGPQMFRVDGRKRKHETLTNFFNPINTSPQFELISDEEKLNIDRVLGQPERSFFCYRVGSVAGLFHLKSDTFDDIPEKDINYKLIEKMHNLV